MRAYQTLPVADRMELHVEKFMATVGHAGLRNHLLARKPADIDEAVQASEEYMSLNQRRGKEIQYIRAVEEDAEATVLQVSQAPVASPTLDPTLKAVLETMQRMMEELTRRRGRTPARGTEQRAPRSLTCWTCGEQGHVKRNCPKAVAESAPSN